MMSKRKSILKQSPTKLISCVCNDLVYSKGELLIRCCICESHLHAECLGIDRSDLPKQETFICVWCGTALLLLRKFPPNLNNIIFNDTIPALVPEHENIICICDEQNESGFMLECENCNTWQHGTCMGLKDGTNPRTYQCYICNSKQLGVEVVEESDNNRTVTKNSDTIILQDMDCTSNDSLYGNSELSSDVTKYSDDATPPIESKAKCSQPIKPLFPKFPNKEILPTATSPNQIYQKQKSNLNKKLKLTSDNRKTKVATNESNISLDTELNQSFDKLINTKTKNTKTIEESKNAPTSSKYNTTNNKRSISKSVKSSSIISRIITDSIACTTTTNPQLTEASSMGNNTANSNDKNTSINDDVIQTIQNDTTRQPEVISDEVQKIIDSPSPSRKITKDSQSNIQSTVSHKSSELEVLVSEEETSSSLDNIQSINTKNSINITSGTHTSIYKNKTGKSIKNSKNENVEKKKVGDKIPDSKHVNQHQLTQSKNCNDFKISYLNKQPSSLLPKYSSPPSEQFSSIDADNNNDNNNNNSIISIDNEDNNNNNNNNNNDNNNNNNNNNNNIGISSNNDNNSKSKGGVKRHRSSEIHDTIKCLCGNQQDSGLMLQCDICEYWQHVKCIGIAKGQPLPDKYCCFDCINKGYFSCMVELCNNNNISVDQLSQRFNSRNLNLISKVNDNKRKLSSEFQEANNSASSKRNKSASSSLRNRSNKTHSIDSLTQPTSSSLITNDPLDNTLATHSDSGSNYSEDSIEKIHIPPIKKKKATPIAKSNDSQINDTKKTKAKFKTDVSDSLVVRDPNEIEAIKNLFLRNITPDEKTHLSIMPASNNYIKIATKKDDVIEKYLPKQLNYETVQMSCDVASKPEITNIPYFHTYVYPSGNRLLLNVGCRVSNLEWLPDFDTPTSLKRCIFALTTEFNFTDNEIISYDIASTKSETPETDSLELQTETVQIWSIDYDIKPDTAARLDFAIVMKFGKIMDMKWCPSGCNQDASEQGDGFRRLGLLLFAFTTGKLGILSIPYLENMESCENLEKDWYSNQFYRCEYLDVVLEVSSATSKEDSPGKCLCCDWSLLEKHKNIAAGFEKGLIGIWRLDMHGLTRKIDSNCENSVVLRPIILIKAHDTSVICITWSPLHPYYFASASHECLTCKIWDMRQPYTNVSFLTNSIVSVTWAICWPIAYLRPICAQESFSKNKNSINRGNLHTCTFKALGTPANNTLNFHFDKCPPLNCLSASITSNAFLIGSFTGEIFYLHSFHNISKRPHRVIQIKKIIDCSFELSQESDTLLEPYEPEKVKSLHFKYDFSCFNKCTVETIFRSSVDRLAASKKNQDQLLSSPKKKVIPKSLTCDICHKKFGSFTAIKYHLEHDVCLNPNYTSESYTPKKNRISSNKHKTVDTVNDTLSSLGTDIPLEADILHDANNHTSSVISEEPSFTIQSDFPPSRNISSHAYISQVKWYPSVRKPNLFAFASGVGIVTICSTPDLS